MVSGINHALSSIKKEIIFGHHFTSIAGTGPIVGPAITITWGWVPAMVWIFVGSIVMAAVHDFGALIVSMRSKAVETIEYEAKELDNIFAILVLGAFIGIPSPPIHITMALLP
jgi:carbon starvation protein CstA